MVTIAAVEHDLPEGDDVLEDARSALLDQARALERQAERLDHAFCEALEVLLACRGRVVVCGMGKSGLVGRKIAATLASTGAPAFFLHPAEAAHGDLGMVTAEDVVLLISKSGESEEVVRLLGYFGELALPVIAITGNPGSSIAAAATAVLDVSVEREPCPHRMVPTTSSLLAQAMGDALAMAAMRKRKLSVADLRRLHPCGPGQASDVRRR